jgi:L-fuculose-phosphate aldolase/L-ribulose-5-phosphate 4-epimerase
MKPELKTLREQLVRAARRAYESGLQSGNGGNLSARAPGEQIILIKPSGTSFGEITEENLVAVDLEGRVIGGSGRPSRELQTHLEIYRLRADVNGILHSHSPWAIACAELFSQLPLHAYHARDKIGEIPILDIDAHADEQVVAGVRALLEENPNAKAFIQRRHGIFAMAENIMLAEHHAELVEETAQIAWLVRGG